MPDHAHILLELSKTMSIAKTIQKIKGVSSKWLNDNHFSNRKFAWQVGYGAFSIGHSGLDQAIRYIHNQKKHHEHKSFKEEFIELLQKYNIDYDERYLLGVILIAIFRVIPDGILSRYAKSYYPD
jgi:putative transposase